MTQKRSAHEALGIRRLRSLYAVVFLFLIVFVVVDGEPDNAATFGTLVGASIVVLGLEVGFRQIKLPFPSNDEPEEKGGATP